MLSTKRYSQHTFNKLKLMEKIMNQIENNQEMEGAFGIVLGKKASSLTEGYCNKRQEDRGFGEPKA